MQLRPHHFYHKVTLIIIVTGLSLSFHDPIIRPTLTSTTAMRVVVQRVKSASVSLVAENGNTDEILTQIGSGLVALVGIHVDDTIEDVNYCCQRLINCKLWNNDNDKPWKYSVKQKQYECLIVSQFTLYGTLSKKSYQPDYKLAMKSESARALYEQFRQAMNKLYAPDKIHDGRFGAMMDVALINDGPVTLIIESRGCDDNRNINDDDINNNSKNVNDDIPTL